METAKHREEVIRFLTKLDERQRTIFKKIEKIENHLAEQNGRIRELENDKTKLYTIVGIISFLTPVMLKALNLI